MIASIDDIRQRTWDFALTIITVVLLGVLGIQSFAGTFYVWWQSNAITNWQQSPGYNAYVGVMNAIAAPLIVALVVAMGLCVPKRLFARRTLLWVSLAMVAVGGAVSGFTGSISTGLTVYLLLSAAIQLAVVVLTVAGVRGPSYLTEGRLTKTGSGLLHLGFIVFMVVVVSLQGSPMMTPVFWLSAALIVVGTVLSFYAGAVAYRRPGRAPLAEQSATDEVSFDWHAPEDKEPAEDAADDADAERPAPEREEVGPESGPDPDTAE